MGGPWPNTRRIVDGSDPEEPKDKLQKRRVPKTEIDPSKPLDLARFCRTKLTGICCPLFGFCHTSTGEAFRLSGPQSFWPLPSFGGAAFRPFLDLVLLCTFPIPKWWRNGTRGRRSKTAPLQRRRTGMHHHTQMREGKAAPPTRRKEGKQHKGKEGMQHHQRKQEATESWGGTERGQNNYQEPKTAETTEDQRARMPLPCLCGKSQKWTANAVSFVRQKRAKSSGFDGSNPVFGTRLFWSLSLGSSGSLPSTILLVFGQGPPTSSTITKVLGSIICPDAQIRQDLPRFHSTETAKDKKCPTPLSKFSMSSECKIDRPNYDEMKVPRDWGSSRLWTHLQADADFFESSKRIFF